MPYQKKISRKTRNDPDGFFRINNELKPLIQRARALGAPASIPQITESNRFINLNKQTGAIASMSFYRDFALCPDLNPMGGPRITFARASGGTRVNQQGLIELMGANVPRFDYDPVTYAGKGLLIEEARTNLSFPGGPWLDTVTNGASTAGQSDPSGGAAAFLVSFTDPSNLSKFAFRVANPVSFMSGLVYTRSVFVKPGSANRIQLTFSAVSHGGGQYVNFLLGGAGSVTSSSFATGTIQRFNNDWYLLSITATALATASANTGEVVLLLTGLEGRLPSTTQIGTFSTWGEQLEVGSFPTSYIPTTSATATRAADIATITGSDFNAFYKQDEGTYCVNFVCNNAGTAPRLIESIGSEKIASLSAINTLTWTVNGSGLSIIINTAMVKNSVAFNWNSAESLMVANGGAVSSRSITNVLGVTGISIGNRTDGARALNGTIARLVFISRRISDSALQSLTG